MTLHVPSFGGGVVLEGAADTRRIDEVLRAESVDIGPRGALICASDTTDYVTLNDGQVASKPWVQLHGILSAMPGFNQAQILAIGEGVATNDFGIYGLHYGPAYILQAFARSGQISPTTAPSVFTAAVSVAGNPPIPPSPNGVIVTGYSWPGTWQIGPTVNISLICLGARENDAPRSNANFGLWVAQQKPGSNAILVQQIVDFNALGTGSLGDGVLLPNGTTDSGTKSQQLYFRGIAVHNNFVFGWGFDSADTTNGDGPCRVMFSNLGKPLKWGNDNIVVPPATVPAGDRYFTDSDAIVLGGAGEIVRAGISALGKMWFGTNRGLHFIQGYGRDTFLTNGTVPVMNGFNVVGPGAIIEGPDRALYGICDQGLWRFDGYALPQPLFERVRDYTNRSTGWFDLIWTDPGAAIGYPGRTNGDLVWMAVDYLRQQVLIGIPFCNASSGAGVGNDTVVIRYHVKTGGFTRQVFAGIIYTAAGYSRREGQQPETRFMGTATAGQVTVQSYASQVNPTAAAVMPRTLPTFEFGPYAPFGPDGQGVVQRGYLTLSWASVSALPLVFRIIQRTDDAQVNRYLLTIDQQAPVAPSPGDCWLDTSESDPSIGNAVSGANVPATGGFLFKTWNTNTWQLIAGQGSKGLRSTIPLTLIRRVGTRVRLEVDTLVAGGRFQIEGLGLDPGSGTPDA